MGDFKDAFKRGILASERADTLRAEADRVIEDFARQVSEAAERKFQLFLSEPFGSLAQRAIGAVYSAVNGVIIPEGKRLRTIVAQVRVRNVSGSQETLCALTFSPNTYPIEIQWDTEILMCHNSGELADALNSLVADPRTGKKFRKLLDQYPQIAEQANEQAPRLTDGSQDSSGENRSASDGDSEPDDVEPT